MSDLLVPVSHLALEIGTPADTLAAQLADQTLIDDIGRVCVDRDTARQLIANHQAAQAAEAERRQAQARDLAAYVAAEHAKIGRGVRSGGFDAVADLIAANEPACGYVSGPRPAQRTPSAAAQVGDYEAASVGTVRVLSPMAALRAKAAQ